MIDDARAYAIAKDILRQGPEHVDYHLAELAIAAFSEQARTGKPHDSFAPLILLGHHEDEYFPEVPA